MVEAAAVATYSRGHTALSVPVISRQEAYFYVQRFGSFDPADETRRWLTLEEGFYLLSAGRIQIPGVDREAAWDAFTSADATFPARYVAYAHFRDAGWLVQSGLLYGVTYSLYRRSPDVVHSEYMVYVHASPTSLSWHALQMLTRLAEDVKKTVVLFQVLPVPLSSTAASSSTAAIVDVCSGVQFSHRAMRIRHWEGQCVPAAAGGTAASYAMADSTPVPKR
ncbi:Aste57867_8723 [Aphanomyces stellatus]|uniref:tRNA-intron lyase n=1 Tax=Aphanomyces stellatus TaxID=120398 RepID=A0A485KL75_9STRA|nr:hypothetical protein As57867_008689 [Aphanomyces stellatus]VFT85609.1 Aste57867_8723 [Aphanomyces stellatus]